jgi:hypothetical protein
MIMEGDVQSVSEYKEGTKNRWLLGDLDHLLARLFRSNRWLRLPPGFPSRWKSWWQFLRFFDSNLKYEVLTSDDPRPGFFELKEYLKQLITKVS